MIGNSKKPEGTSTKGKRKNVLVNREWLTMTRTIRVRVREDRHIQTWSLTSGACREALAKTQGRRHVQQQRTRGLEVGRAATEVYGRRRIPCAVQHGPEACSAAVAAAAKKQEISPYCLIPSYHIWGSTVVLPAAEPKGPLTLMRPCVRCCSALWAWRCKAVRFVREAKAPRWADFFLRKVDGGLWQQCFLYECYAPNSFLP